MGCCCTVQERTLGPIRESPVDAALRETTGLARDVIRIVHSYRSHEDAFEGFPPTVVGRRRFVYTFAGLRRYGCCHACSCGSWFGVYTRRDHDEIELLLAEARPAHQPLVDAVFPSTVRLPMEATKPGCIYEEYKYKAGDTEIFRLVRIQRDHRCAEYFLPGEWSEYRWLTHAEALLAAAPLVPVP